MPDDDPEQRAALGPRPLIEAIRARTVLRSLKP
jgi:hypothetical protein